MKKITFTMIVLIISISVFSAEITQKLERPDHVFIGSPMHLKIDITTLESDSVFTAKIDTVEIFQVIDINQSEIYDEDISSMIHKIDIKFAPFETGKHEFPALEFTVMGERPTQKLKSDPFEVEIKSVITDSSQVIKDIQNPVKMHFGFWEYFVPIISIIILIVITYFAIKFIKGRKKQQEKIEKIDNRPAYLKAMEKLEELKAKNLLSKGKFIDFHFGLSMVLRYFLELQFRFNAMEMTTNEIRENFKSDAYQEKNKVLEYLQYSDKIKFAKYETTIADSEEYLKWFENYLKMYEKKYFEMKERNKENV